MSNPNQYIILKSSSRIGLREPFTGPNGIRSATLSRERFAPEIEINAETLSNRDIADIRRDPKVVNIAPVMQAKLVFPKAIVPSEQITSPGNTWGMSVTRAVDSRYTGEGVVVAVLDTGIDDSHVAFNGMQLIQQDFTNTHQADNNGHGTHVAGTIFGKSQNGYRFGVAPGIRKALICKVFDDDGLGTTEGISKAILWAAGEGAHIISMSLGFSFKPVWDYYIQDGWPEDLALDRALEAYRANIRLFDSLSQLLNNKNDYQKGSLLVAAAGNETKRATNPNYELTVAPPAAADGVVSVGALEYLGGNPLSLGVAEFSNTNPDVVAPGVDIYSARTGGGYQLQCGTSMATPHVAGIAALWAEKFLNETCYVNINALSSRMIGMASKDLLVNGFDPFDVGEGLVQAPI